MKYVETSIASYRATFSSKNATLNSYNAAGSHSNVTVHAPV